MKAARAAARTKNRLNYDVLLRNLALYRNGMDTLYQQECFVVRGEMVSVVPISDRKFWRYCFWAEQELFDNAKSSGDC